MASARPADVRGGINRQSYESAVWRDTPLPELKRIEDEVKALAA